MRIVITFLVTLLLTGIISTSEAQPVPPNCPPAFSAGYQIVGDSISFCQDGVNLQLIASSTLKSTDSYAVDPIPYNPYPWVGANTLFVGQDDIWSGVIPLPFPFCFFGQKYNSVVIGANGQVGFDITQATLGNAWASATWLAPTALPPTSFFPNGAMDNTIMAPYHDVDPSVPFTGKNITWDIYGTAPCRYMVISWDSVPMFSCNNLLASQQIVLFESTYLIDINIKEKTLCANWNSGTAHEGIQNANGTSAFMVPGRNGTQWTATNDSYRFTPAGLSASNVTYVWKEVPSGIVLGTGPTLSFFPATNTKVTVDMTVITDCDTIFAALRDTIDLIVTGQVTAGFTYDVRLGCEEDTVIFTNTSVSTGGGVPFYVWSFGDGVSSSSSSPMHVYTTQNQYTVRLIANDNGCIDTLEATIDLRHPINAYFIASSQDLSATPPVVHIDSACLGIPMNVDATGIPGSPIYSSYPLSAITFEWNWGDGSPLENSGTSPTAAHVYANPGVYSILLTITDTLGCIDTFRHSVYIDTPPFIDFTASDYDVCVGDPVFFSDTMVANTLSFEWDFGDSKKLVDVHHPTHTWSTPGIYTVTLVGDYRICDTMTVTRIITVNPYPTVNLGPDSSICPGLTGALVLTNLNPTTSPTQPISYTWHSGETSPSISVSESGRYWLKESIGECSTTDSIWIKRDCYINIPNSFSPGGDGLNDYFLPREILSSGLKTFKMNIYNRWGENIFSTTSIDGRGWDGKYNGMPQPIGVYVYIIEVEFINNMRKVFQGNVTLVR
jgi:gliding motility-associated-like protein